VPVPTAASHATWKTGCFLPQSLSLWATSAKQLLSRCLLCGTPIRLPRFVRQNAEEMTTDDDVGSYANFKQSHTHRRFARTDTGVDLTSFKTPRVARSAAGATRWIARDTHGRCPVPRGMQPSPPAKSPTIAGRGDVRLAPCAMTEPTGEQTRSLYSTRKAASSILVLVLVLHFPAGRPFLLAGRSSV
jgi:hypothetical protein